MADWEAGEMQDQTKEESQMVGEPKVEVRAEQLGSEPESDLPSELARPARRALAGAGYVRLEQFTELSEAEVLRLHGMGPRALDQIRRALAARGQSFAAPGDPIR